jgi:glycosyltransferase involved in cell wall biosynthesis
MRILMLTQSYPPVVGGIERLVEDLSAELARRGHQVGVATLRQPVGEPAAFDGVEIHTLGSSIYRVPALRLDPERHHAPPAPDPETVRDLRRLVRREQPDVVHAHNWLVHSYLPVDRCSDAALVLSMHDYGLICATKRFLNRGAICTGPGPAKCVDCAADYYGSVKGAAVALSTRLFERRVRRHVDLFLPVSAAVRDLCRLGPADLNRVIPNFIGDLPAPAQADDPRLAGLPDEPFILYFGDVTLDKGVDRLVEAYTQLERRPPLVLIGRCYLEELTDVPGVIALGTMPHRIVVEALRRSLFTVVPSILPEAFGLVALETAAAGKPIVASRIGGLTDVVVDGETGLLVPPGDRDALRLAIARLLEDAALRERMGEAAKRRAGDFGPDTVVPQFEAAYEAAIEARRSRARSKRRR